MRLNPFRQVLFFHFLILLFCAPQVIAQHKLLEGYVISSTGDTLKGVIRYKEWEVSPTFIEFKNKSGLVQNLTTDLVREFYIPSVNQRYKMFRIGILDIDLSQTFNTAPSIVAKDSADIFLKEVTSGTNASLYNYTNNVGVSHYFLLKGSNLTELINYPYYRTVDNTKYLVKYDAYKNQLPAILNDSENFKMPLPIYDERSIKKYVEKYNESLGEVRNTAQIEKTESGFLVDMNFMVGIEGWKETGVNLKNALGYGIGMRVNLPRKFNNRYFKIALILNPGISTGEVYNYSPDEKLTIKTIDIGVGTHLTTGNIRPFIGLDYNFPINNWRSVSFGPHTGLSFRRQLNIEVSHFANLTSVISESPFFNRPRISLSYYLNLNTVFKGKG
jgi:hypothetical protein